MQGAKQTWQQWYGAVAFALLLASIPAWFGSLQSFWIDEAMTWNVAARSFSDAVNVVTTTSASETQMPGYLLYVWTWDKLFGNSEVISRLSNAPWLAITAIIWWQWAFLLFPGCRIRRSLFLLILPLSPFFIYYATEYRPYAAIIALSALINHGLIIDAREGSIGKWLVLVSYSVICTLSMLATVLIVPLILYELSRIRNPMLVIKSWTKQIVVAAILMVPLAWYYIGTLSRGAGGSRSAPGVKSLIYIAYEFTGFGGLGPSRHALHSNQSINAFAPYLMPLLTLLLPLATIVIISAISALRTRAAGVWSEKSKELIRAGICFGVFSILLLFIVSYAAGFRIVGRHVAFAWIPLLAATTFLLLHQAGRLRLLLMFLILFALALSSGRSLFLYEHARDDYRQAAIVAREQAEAGTRVILAGNYQAFQYYMTGTPSIRIKDRFPTVLHTRGTDTETWQDLLEQSLPSTGSTVIILGKPYIYDTKKSIQKWIQSQTNAESIGCPATFEVWGIK